jgi:hypothetical protein
VPQEGPSVEDKAVGGERGAEGEAVEGERGGEGEAVEGERGGEGEAVEAVEAVDLVCRRERF